MYCSMSPWMATADRTSAPQEFPDQLFPIFAADVFWISFRNVYRQNRHRHVLAFEQQVFLLAFARVQQCLEVEPMACGIVSVLFFGEIRLSLKSCSQHSISSNPSSRIAFLLSSVLAYCISRVKNVFPSFLFSKVIRSFCPSGKYSRQPCQWHPWNWSTVFVSNQKPSTRYPAIILFPPWPHILIDMNTPPPGLELHPAYRHSRMRPLSIKRFFICHFGNLDLLSSAQHLDCPSRTSLCIPPQVACFGESFFDTRHTHSGSTLCRDSLSGKRDLRRC